MAWHRCRFYEIRGPQDGSGWIVKIANTDEDPLIIDCQSEALAHIQRIDPSISVPRIRLTTDRRKTAKVRSDRGSVHILYAPSFLEGKIAEKIESRTPQLQRVGAMQVRLGKSLRVFFIPRPASSIQDFDTWLTTNCPLPSTRMTRLAITRMGN